MWCFSFITHDWGGDELLMPQVLRGFPQVFAVAPAVTLGLGSLPPERLKYASGLFNMMRNLGGAVGIAVCGAIINDRTNSHFLDIATHLTPANGAMEQLLHGMAARWGAALGGPVAGHAGGIIAALASGLPRGVDPRLCRCVSRDHGRVYHRHDARAAAAESDAAQSRPDRSALTRLRLTSVFGIDGSGFAIKKGQRRIAALAPIRLIWPCASAFGLGDLLSLLAQRE